MRVHGVPPVEGGRMSTEIIAWLRSAEGEEWSRRRIECPFYSGQFPVMRRDGLVDPAEDPCGRPPIVPGQAMAATGECG